MEARTRLICNLGTRDFFRLTDDETDTTLYPQIWYRTDYTVKRDGKKKYECYQQNGEKLISFMSGNTRVFHLDKAEAAQIWKAMEEAAKEAVKAQEGN
ncbi:MAG: hypothetical protein II008_15940 [Oscillospiraceae bacterium]|nr:hypothetical protein [Oscillospiraceae bacterium]